jgi:hypothetical protein
MPASEAARSPKQRRGGVRAPPTPASGSGPGPPRSLQRARSVEHREPDASNDDPFTRRSGRHGSAPWRCARCMRAVGEGCSTASPAPRLPSRRAANSCGSGPLLSSPITPCDGSRRHDRRRPTACSVYVTAPPTSAPASPSCGLGGTSPGSARRRVECPSRGVASGRDARSELAMRWQASRSRFQSEHRFLGRGALLHPRGASLVTGRPGLMRRTSATAAVLWSWASKPTARSPRSPRPPAMRASDAREVGRG